MIKNFVIILLFLFSTMFSLRSQITLTIDINNLKNDKGQVLLELRDGNDNFINGFTGQIINKSCTFTIKDLNPGKYSFKYFHDENKNKKLDFNWMGIPTEGFGFSNNAKAIFGAPSFGETVIEITKNTKLNCELQYFQLF